MLIIVQWAEACVVGCPGQIIVTIKRSTKDIIQDPHQTEHSLDVPCLIHSGLA